MPRDLNFREKRSSVEEEMGWDKPTQVNGLVFMDSAHCDPILTTSVLTLPPMQFSPTSVGMAG